MLFSQSSRAPTLAVCSGPILSLGALISLVAIECLSLHSHSLHSENYHLLHGCHNIHGHHSHPHHCHQLSSASFSLMAFTVPTFTCPSSHALLCQSILSSLHPLWHMSVVQDSVDDVTPAYQVRKQTWRDFCPILDSAALVPGEILLSLLINVSE